MRSEHFNEKELACRCGCSVNLATPELLTALELFRCLVGVPVTINSATRCVVHNRAEGGAPNSAHVRGLAADVMVSGLTAAQLEAVARQVPTIQGIGRDDRKGYIHIDVRADGPAEWCYGSDGKKVAYYPPTGEQNV